MREHSPLRFLIVNADYPEFLADLYGSNPDLAHQPYEVQLQARYNSLFSLANFYSANLRLLGHEAWDLYLNNEHLQRAWAAEHGLRVRTRNWRLVMRRGFVPWLRAIHDDQWLREVFAAQVEHYKPDVLINHNAFAIGDDYIRRVRSRIRRIVVQHAATQPPTDRDWTLYDCCLSSYPPTVEFFSKLGRPAHFLPLGFEPEVLSRISPSERDIPVSFVGSFHGVHSSRVHLLEAVASTVPLSIWTGSSFVYQCRHRLMDYIRGTAWGIEMYRILARSQITLNHHGDIGPYANNLRLFEATGMGCLLVTDDKPNLQDYFRIGDEVVTYSDPVDCVAKVQYYLSHPDEAARVASAGQRRTLTEHTWRHRMELLLKMLEPYL